MNAVPPALRELARRAIAIEAARRPAAAEARPESAGARLRLQRVLVDLMGVGGYCGLVARALALASDEASELRDMEMDRHGCPQGLEHIAGPRQAEVEAVLLAHILGLLVTLLGDGLTASVARRAWPDAAREKLDQTGEGQA
jgi:hypothetical protein